MAPASPPFDRDDADVVLRSSDNVDFRVHRMILSVASPVFKDMFHIPPPAALAVEDTHPETGLPLVQLAEDSRTLDNFLRLCYPFKQPVMDCLEDIHAFLRAARKYEYEYGIVEMRAKLIAFAPQKPLRVYAIACSMELEAEARFAATESPSIIPMDLESFTQLGLDQITSGQLFRLMEFLARSFKGIFEYAAPSTNMHSEGDTTHTTLFLTPHVPDHPPDVLMRSCDGADFRVHKFMLSMVSPELARMLSESPESEVGLAAQESLQVIHLPENGRTLSKLLHFCYPIETPELECFDVAHTVLMAAKKYQVARAVETARKKWMEYIRTDHLRTYFIAMMHGWMEEAREAAKYAVFHYRDIYVPEMDSLPAEAYRRLWDYRQRSQAALKLVFPGYSLIFDSGSALAGFNGLKAYPPLWIGVLSELATKDMIDGPCSHTTILSPVLDQNLRQSRYRQSSRSVQSIIAESKGVQEKLQEALSTVCSLRFIMEFSH
ncbi:hypothetical protein A0H81_05205 [Grifola frondosa]|uniref:BTB domain-containing protein n=1 Tax=Grifola frondosa TaxID=5627 RepID=A0A1C7MDA2_GRIFR|nr:hypothetical protein A0H81_05205 [Grifola frondosa]